MSELIATGTGVRLRVVRWGEELCGGDDEFLGTGKGKRGKGEEEEKRKGRRKRRVSELSQAQVDR